MSRTDPTEPPFQRAGVDEPGRGRPASPDEGPDGVVLLPSPRPVASVRFADPPAVPPDSLATFVVPVVDGRTLVDWHLTEDTIAFGDPSVPLAFTEWRATWEQCWTLEPVAALVRLMALGRAAGMGDGPWFRMVEGLAHGRDQRVPVADLGRLGAECEDLRDLVRGRAATGFGVVDATPDRIASGMAFAWSGCAGPEVLARNDLLEVAIDPELGLCVTVGPVDDTVAVVEGIVEGRVVGDGTIVSTTAGERHLDVEQATPLGWLLPGIARWRVRRVPEVMVWARTFAGLPECCDVAERHDVDVLVGLTPPIASISSEERKG